MRFKPRSFSAAARLSAFLTASVATATPMAAFASPAVCELVIPDGGLALATAGWSSPAKPASEPVSCIAPAVAWPPDLVRAALPFAAILDRDTVATNALTGEPVLVPVAP